MTTTKAESPDRTGTPLLVTILVTEDHLAVIDPPLGEVAAWFTEARPAFVPGGPAGYRRVATDEMHYAVDRKGRPVISAGHLYWVVPRLEGLWYRVAVDDRRRRPDRFRSSEVVVGALDPEPREIVAAVDRESLGQVEVRGPRDAVATCLLLARAFPAARFVFAVATRRQAYRLWRRLERQLGERVDLALPGVTQHGRRIMVGTATAIPRRTDGTWDALVVPCGEEAAGGAFAGLLGRIGFPRQYALIPRGLRADSRTRFRLEQIFGSVIRRIDPPERRVVVAMMPTPACTAAPVSEGDSALDQKRRLYWCDVARNRHVAGVARALAEDDRGALRRLGLLEEYTAVAARRRPRVAVVAESREHARNLQPLLPRWRVCDMIPRDPAELETSVAPRKRSSRGVAKQVLAEAEKETPSDVPDGVDDRAPRIMTARYAATRATRVDVLVVASGTEWTIEVRGFPGAARGDDRPVLLVDFTDAGNPATTHDTTRRVRDYRRRGMDVITVRNTADIEEATVRNSSGADDPVGLPEVGSSSGTAQQSERTSPVPSRSSRWRP